MVVAFNCSFCSIINVQEEMRVRLPNPGRTLRQNYRDHGIYFYFFTDDNFAIRNQCWREIFRDARADERNEKIDPVHDSGRYPVAQDP